MMMGLKAAFGEVIACGRTNRETLESAAACIRHACGSRWVGLYRLDHSRSLVENVVFTGGPAPAHHTFALDKGLTGLAVAQRKTVLVDDVNKDPHYLPTLPDTRTEAIIPVVDGRTVVGTIDIESPVPNSLTEELISALEGCAISLSPFLSNKTLHLRSTRIRPAEDSDLAQITAIHNYYVENTHLSFDIRAFTANQRRSWFAEHSAGNRYRLVVAEDEQHDVIGYATSGRFRAKEAYETTVEVSIQCAPTYRGGGLGRRLYDELFTLLAVEDVRCAVAGIAVPNPASVALHERMGFQRLGTFRQVGRKFQRYWDVVWMQKFLPR
jgi:phosphinothricin acetyltransferase